MHFIKAMYPGMSWAFLIFILSTISPGVLHLPSFWDLFSLDKAAHATCYGILVLLLSIGFRKQEQLKFALLHPGGTAVVFAIIYGGAIELYQGCVLTNRTADWVDFIANCIGSFIGMRIFLNWKTRNQVVQIK